MRFRLFILLNCLSLMLHAEPVTLNFRDMDINDLISLISEITHKTFVVDPRVRAKVTVVSSSPLSQEQVYEVFLSILSVHGFAAVPNGAIIKIMPENLAKSEKTPVLGSMDYAEIDQLVTQVIKINHISAAQLIPILRPLVPQQGHLVAYPANNTLIISDRAPNVNRLLKIIERIDQPQDGTIEVMVLKHASAIEVARILTTLEQKNTAPAAEGAATVPSIIADERTNSILISGEQTTRLQLRALIAHLDIPLTRTAGNTEVIYLRYAQAKNLVDVLKGISDSLAEQKKKVEGKSAPPAQLLKTTIQADETTNSLVITAATAEELNNLKSVIQQLDIRRAQVLVEAIIAEVAEDTARELGVQWIMDGTPGGTGPAGFSNFNNLGEGSGIVDLTTAIVQNSGGTVASGFNVGAGLFLGLGRFNSRTFNFAVILRALAADTNTNVLSTPSLLTLDNQEAEIVVGQNVPFVTGQYTTPGTATANIASPFQTIQRQDIGLKLKVKPQINEGNAVKLEIEQEISGIVPTAAAFADVVTSKRTIKTTVIVEDGNMIVLGGLIDEDLQQISQKVPGLGDLPIIGGLFRSQSSKKVKRNLMVFLRPLIVRDAANEVAVSHSKYSYMQALQLEQRTKSLSLTPPGSIPLLPKLDEFITILPAVPAP